MVNRLFMGEFICAECDVTHKSSREQTWQNVMVGRGVGVSKKGNSSVT